MNKLYITLSLAFTCLMFACNDNKTMKAEYSGDDISNEVSILRDKATKKASIEVNTKEKWTLFAGPTADQIELNNPIAEGSNNGTFSLAVPDSVRSYFLFVTDHGKAISAERHLPMTGGYNFRDLGGYRTTDGRYVKWGKLFRSDELHNLTEADLAYLSAMPLKSVVDFRSLQEINAAPDVNPASVTQNYAYSITPGNLMDAVNLDVNKITTQQVDTMMMKLNELLVTDSASIAQYTRFFELLQDVDKTPLMFHCTAGKDRTGMGAALILASLGVDEQTILDDYLLSNIYLADKYAKLKAENPKLAPLFEVKTEFIKAGLDKIKKDHGSIENYLTTILKVDIQKMKDMYLY